MSLSTMSEDKYGLCQQKGYIATHCLICLHLMFLLFFQSFLQVMYLVVSVMKLVLSESHNSGISLTEKKTEFPSNKCWAYNQPDTCIKAFFLQICDVATVATVHKRKEPNWATVQRVQ